MTWAKKIIEWTNKDHAYLSVVFTWDLPAAYKRAEELSSQGYIVHAGGPAVALMPEYLSDVAICNEAGIVALPRHNPDATFTTRGCVRRCKFCAVPKTEGKFRELDNWEARPIICDNNLLAASKTHFDRVIDRLKPYDSARSDILKENRKRKKAGKSKLPVPQQIDFNQGLDARLLTPYHADRLRELKCITRLAFDSVAYESDFMRAFELLRKARIPKNSIRVYVLFGFNDTPEDALYRLTTVRDLGILPNPMRYQPLGALKKNSYVDTANGWTRKELIRYSRYWANLRYLRAVPFEEFEK